MTLDDLQELFAVSAANLILQAKIMGTPARLGEAWRSPQTCALYAERGLGIRNSNHPQRLALDLVLYKNGVYLKDSADYQPLGEWWKSQSTSEVTFIWGGDFRDKFGNPKPDGNHFSVLYNGIK